PGLLWLIVFFLVPILNQSYVSLESGDAELGYAFDWNFSTYSDAISNYHTQFTRSLTYAGAATVIDLFIAFPLAYFIAVKAGRLPRREPRHRVSQGDAPACGAGHLRGLAADVHPCRRRLHQRRAARHAEPVHDRQRHPVEVPQHPRLPGRRVPVVHVDGRDPD